MTACNRCGQCCWYEIGPEKKLKKCKHLVTLRGSGKTLCRNYTKRKDLKGMWRMEIDRMKIPNTEHDDVTYCQFRDDKNSPYDYPGCPFNKGRGFPPWTKIQQVTK